MIHGVGTDLLDAGRMRRLFERYGSRLPERLLHQAEWPAYRAARDPAHFLARSFAVKEAAAKALGTGFRGIAHHDIGCTRDPLGKPELVFSAHGRSVLAGHGVSGGHVSLSDEGEFVLAFVVLERASM
ncbi:MAG TPA: holo-ACP synthase [Nevskiales bacterium]|nr:holo-ACP synthase [Nevskiales bacterium]